MESEFSIEAATQFSAVAEVVADIVQRGVEAFQRLAEAIGRIAHFLEVYRKRHDGATPRGAIKLVAARA